MLKPYVEKSFLGSAIFYLGGRDAGNVTAATLGYETDSKTLRNARGGGGNIAAAERVSNVNLTLTVSNFDPRNLAIAMQATVDTVVAASVVDEEHDCIANGLTTLDNLVDTSVLPVVKDDGNTVIPALDTNGDPNWTVSVGGIKWGQGIEAAANDGLNIKVSYDKAAASIIQALTAVGAEFPVSMEGLNDNDGNTGLLQGYRWKPAPMDSLDLISEDFATFQMTGPLLADTSKGVGKSQFFQYAIAD